MDLVKSLKRNNSDLCNESVDNIDESYEFKRRRFINSHQKYNFNTNFNTSNNNINNASNINNANNIISSFAMIETQEAVNNIDEILSVPNLTGIYIGPGDMSSSYGKKPSFDVLEDPVYSNIKNIVNKTKQLGKIAGIHNGSTAYAKKMIMLGYQFVTISSDFRSMSLHAQKVVDEMKNIKKDISKSSTY